jgi:hypothetical protein
MTRNVRKSMNCSNVEALYHDMLVTITIIHVNSCLSKDFSDVYYTNFVKKVENETLTFTVTSSLSPHCHLPLMIGRKECCTCISLVREYIHSKATSMALYTYEIKEVVVLYCHQSICPLYKRN